MWSSPKCRAPLDNLSALAYIAAMTARDSSYLPFMKMHGLGNDFVVVDERGIAPRVDEAIAVSIADRHRGVGFDQLAVLSETPDADLRLVFWNSDGSQSAACGNATRCIARYVMDQTGATALTLQTERGILPVSYTHLTLPTKA